MQKSEYSNINTKPVFIGYCEKVNKQCHFEGDTTKTIYWIREDCIYR